MKNGKHNLTKKLQFVVETVFMIYFLWYNIYCSIEVLKYGI